MYVCTIVILIMICTGDIDKSNLYLKLFKLVFGSVTLFAQENEVMLKVCILIVCMHVCTVFMYVTLREVKIGNWLAIH